MLEDLGFLQSFLQRLFPVPLSHFEPLPAGWHAQCLGFRAQEHALVFKMSRNAEALQQEAIARQKWGPQVPVPPVYYSGQYQEWAWIVQARCAGKSLEQSPSPGVVPRLFSNLKPLHALTPPHREQALQSMAQWCDDLKALYGFQPAELKTLSDLSGELSTDPLLHIAALTPERWLNYRGQLWAQLAVYDQFNTDWLGWIHGDLKPAHVFYTPNGQQLTELTELTGIIDWEQQRWGDPLYDVACLLWHWPDTPAFQGMVARVLTEYVQTGLCCKGGIERLRASLLHTALGSLFMLWQSGQLTEYAAKQERLDAFLDEDLESLL